MKLFEVEKLSYYAPNKGYNVKLIEINGNISFSILVGSNEAQSIALALEGIETPRPMIHDIVIDLLFSSDITLDKVEICNFVKGIYYARLYIKNINIGIKKIDCRPSDAIAIALRYCCPIHVKKNVLDSIVPRKIISDITFNSIEEFKSQNNNSSVDIMKKLSYALDAAVNKEDYEIAAKLRDKIKSLDI